MVTRLSGGLTPGDGSDPRTFPAIWNVTADEIEAQGTAISGAESDIDTLEGKNIPAFGTATPSDGQVLTFDSAGSEYVPEDVVASLADLTDTDISSPSSGEVLEYDGTNWVNAAAAGGGGRILQVGEDTMIFGRTTTSTSFQNITGLSEAITASDINNKLLVFVSFLANTNGDFLEFRVLRDGNVVNNLNNIRTGTASGGLMLQTTTAYSALLTAGTTSSQSFTTEFRSKNGGSVKIEGEIVPALITVFELEA